MEKSCCNFQLNDEVRVECHETEDGYQLTVKGDKDKLRAWKDRCCSQEGKSSCC